jgi:hypothetical protein
MPLMFTCEQTYCGIKALVGVKPPDTAKQHGADGEIEQLPRRILRDIPRFIVEADNLQDSGSTRAPCRVSSR